MKDLGRDESVGRLLERAFRRRVTANSLDDCPGADTLAAWSDGTLTASERASVEAHAADCARCQAHLAAIARMTPADTPQSALESAIRSAIRSPRSAIRAPVAWRWLVPVTAAAAALVLWVWVQPPPPSGSAEYRAQVQTSAAPAAEPPAYLAQPPAPVADPALRTATPPGRTATARADAASAPAAAAPKEEARSLDSIVAERERDRNTASERALPFTRSDDARRERASANAPAMAPAPPALSALAESAAQRTLEVVSPDTAIRWRISGSTIQRSTDAGATWQPQSPGVDAQFTAGAAPQPSVCWLVGRGGIVLLSTDGRTWRRRPFPEAVDLVGVTASSAASASVTTADGRILTTSDAGASWVIP